MKNIILLTDKPIEKDSCREIFLNVFPNKEIINDDKESLLLGRPYSNINVIYSYDRVLDENSSFSEDDAKHIPLNNPYCTIVEFHKIAIAKQAVSALVTKYPELYIYYDEEDWYGTPVEFEQFIS